VRKLWLVPAIGLALLLVLLLLRDGSSYREGGGSRGEEGYDHPRASAPRADAKPGMRTGATPSPEGDSAGTGAATEGIARRPVDGHLVYLDGSPAEGVALHVAIGRPLEVTILRNGERSAMTIHLVTDTDITTTAEDGAFHFRALQGPTGARVFVYTDHDPHAFVVAELTGVGETVQARRIVEVTGRLVGPDGKAIADYWFEGRFGNPEDWQTRIRREEDTFVGESGDLRVDTLAIADARTKADGSFTIRLAEGRNALVFGELKSDGSVDVPVSPPSTAAGELRVPGAPLSGGEHTLTGQVLALSGAPNTDCEVRAWDGSVGQPTHTVMTDEKGMFTIEGLRSSHVILWAVPTERRHIDLPMQTSGTIRMPCDAPVLLQAPAEREYSWVGVSTPGFYLFVRKNVFATGDALERTDAVGLPPGPLDIYTVTGGRILETSLEIGGPETFRLDPRKFRDTTWE
jgi:hypothetical protein